MRSLRQAIGFLTILPVNPGDVAPAGPARSYFPLVGLTLGGALAGLDIALGQVLPSMVVGAVLLIALLALTRALHTEGFLDVCDGLLGGYSPSERLRILRDTHVGAFAVIGGTGLLLLKWTLLVGIPDAGRIGLLVLFPCMSRLGMVVAMEAFSYVRRQGIGSSFQVGRSRWQVAFALATALAAGGLLVGTGGLILVGTAIVVSLGLGWTLTRLLGGLTGDAYGAINEVAEVCVLVMGVALLRELSGLFQAPFW